MWPIIALAGLSYIVDVPIRRASAAKRARAYARMRGGPLLNVGAGTNRSALFGATLYGDFNTDLAGIRGVPHGTPGVVTYADAENLPFETGSIGAVLASHVLEHLPHPDRALAEWRRVTGDPEALFVVTPSWWAPHTWLHAGHLWYFPDSSGCTDGACSPKPLRGHPGAGPFGRLR